MFHVIELTSHKQCRISHSSYSSEIIAVDTADDRGIYHKTAVNTLFPQKPVKHDHNIDSHALCNTISILHQGK